MAQTYLGSVEPKKITKEKLFLCMSFVKHVIRPTVAF